MAIPKNQTEVVALNQFRSLTEDLNLEDGILMRFLRARNLDCVKAEEMIRKSVIWRRDAPMNQFDNWEPPAELLKFPPYITGFDHHGRPVMYCPHGQSPTLRYYVEQGMEMDVLKSIGKSVDRFYKILLKTKHQQLVVIVDADGLSYSKILQESTCWRGLEILIQLARDFDANFPELLNHLYCINTPKAFMWLWKLIGPHLSEETNSKIHFYGSSKEEAEKWKADLFNYLPEGAIPGKYGGSAKLISALDDNLEKLISSIQ